MQWAQEAIDIAHRQHGGYIRRSEGDTSRQIAEIIEYLQYQGLVTRNNETPQQYIVEGKKLTQQLKVIRERKMHMLSELMAAGLSKPGQISFLSQKAHSADISPTIGAIADNPAQTRASAPARSALTNTQAPNAVHEAKTTSPAIIRKAAPSPRPRLSLQPLPPAPFHENTQRSAQATASVGGQSIPIALPRSLPSSPPQYLIHENLEKMKKKFISILENRVKNTADMNKMQINYKRNSDKDLQSMMRALNEFTDLSNQKDDVSIQIALIGIQESSKKIADFFNAVVHDSKLLLALEGWHKIPDEIKIVLKKKTM